MTTSDDVRHVLDPLPRSYEVEVRGRWKYRVGSIVYVAFSADEQSMGFGFPREARSGLVAANPETFFLPPTSDLRFGWVCAHLEPLDTGEMRELVLDAWRMCTPKMLHDLPELPQPALAAWSALEAEEWTTLHDLLDPEVVWAWRHKRIVGRSALLEMLREHPRGKPPGSRVEVRDGRIRQWTR